MFVYTDETGAHRASAKFNYLITLELAPWCFVTTWGLYLTCNNQISEDGIGFLTLHTGIIIIIIINYF